VQPTGSSALLRIAPQRDDAGSYSFTLIATDTGDPPLATEQVVELVV
jgi:hypothetical protein